MKKTVVYLLIATLLFSLTGCIGLSKKHGAGELIILGDNLTRDPDPEFEEEIEDPQEVDLANVTVTVAGQTKKLGEAFLLRTGTYNAKIVAQEFEGQRTFEYTLENIVISKPNQKVTLSPKAKLDIVLTNAWKFIFDPERWGVTVEEKVHLVGNFPLAEWDTTGKYYPLIKQEDDTWSAIFPAPEGTMFKFIYDSDDWGNDIGPNPENPMENFLVGVHDVAQPVLAWKFTFDPSTVDGLDEALGDKEIESVSVVGSFGEKQWGDAIPYHKLVKQEDGTWVGYFEADKGAYFKFVVNGDIWIGTAGIGGFGDDYLLDEIPGIATQKF